jgi:hypothetical protein
MPGSQTSSRHPPLSREEIAPLVGECFHPARSLGQADLYRLKGESAGWVLKDFAKRPLWIRLLVIRRVVRREARALSALQGVDGVPRSAGCVGPDALVIEKLDAERLPHLGVAHALDARFFERLRSLVERMHQRGWAHGDLRRKNILCDQGFRPYLIDFATAIYGGPGSGILRRRLFEHCARIDLIALARIKASYLPEDLTAEESELLRGQPLSLRIGRWLKKRVYRPLKRRHRRKLWRRIKTWIGGPP